MRFAQCASLEKRPLPIIEGFAANVLAMPIYAYKCSACGYARDILQKMSDALLTTCPECGAEKFTKQLTAAGFQLKGSGWYATDFRGGATPAPVEGASADKPAAAPAETGSAAPAPTPAATPAAAPKQPSTSSAATKKAD